MADEPQYRRGAGGDPANPPLPQGGAQAANEVVVPVTEEEEALAAPEEAEEVLDETAMATLSRQGIFASPGGTTGGFEPSSPEEAAIFAPEEGMTQERYMRRINPTEPPPPPENIGSWLPALAAASRHPNAPLGVRALFLTIIDALFPPGAAGG